MSTLKIGFIGLGLMGNPMAKNILKNKFDLSVYNRTRSKTNELKKLGANVVGSPQELASKVDVLITMVTAGKDVEEVLFGKNGAMKAANKKLIVIDMSTIGPAAAKRIAKKLVKYKVPFLDAPVTGSTPKAITGELTIFIGGEKKVYEKVKPVLLAMGKDLHYMGQTPMGQAIKMVNNQLLAITIEAMAEGMILADKMGLDRAKVTEALSKAPVMSPMMNLKAKNYVTGSYPLFFSVANMKKDVNLALEELKSSKTNLPVLKKTASVYKSAMKKYSNRDFSEVIRVLGK
ncbi:MAG: 6-phosphogluconate dehydrogenase, NAD-binding protein [candidate division WS6 bacterium GW2011_GWA2_37_6]|uniref:6-phosphogluconate dehydrogenase, NAD-binding protein n=1 Tax=candidate division WS6 bacterium GW2011_GWA2_37_6 TaxID=1619087 RepID=A0A0G0K1D6_9BACT|nr:MAG: 6-phosphogluconate dehydrogenase, NAD-binding protein [candidate division WS6 bacterium GW2011_GWA2_37_6]